MDLLNLTRAAAARAAEYIRSVDRPTDPAGWGRKQNRDFVTDVDRTAERLIAEVVQDGAPGSHFIGEESNPVVESRGVTWIVDPLDGTTNFLHGFPWYAVSVAVAVDGVLEAGAIVNVPTGASFHASRGGGAWQGRHRLAVSTISDSTVSLIGTGYPFKDGARVAEYQEQFARVAAGTSGMRRAGSAALDLASVASGQFDAFWEQHLSAWDIAAGALLVREAGGLVTDFTGRDVGVEHSAVIAGNPAMHAWMLAVVAADAELPSGVRERSAGG